MPRTSRASSATARWPKWIGSKVPPISATEPGWASIVLLGMGSHSSSRRPMRTVSPAVTPARRSSASMPRRARLRWNRSADSSTSKLVWAANRSICLPRTRAAVLALDDEVIAEIS